jgi:pimeloyl-ACP methyl ester carboxylesterase
MPRLTVRGGRDLHYETSRPVAPGDAVLVFHHGQPGAGLVPPSLAAAGDRRNLPVVALSRPGYGPSGRMAGRAVADAAADVAAVLDHLGAGRFVTAGWSGGGPHALACGAILAPRCAAVATIAGVAPYGVDGLDFTAGMGPENVAEFEALVAGDPDLEGRIRELCAGLAVMATDQLAAELGGLISPPDRAFLEEGFAAFVGEWFRLACSSGHYGYWDDDQAFVGPWGFEPAQMAVPVQVWTADRDLMVPAAHGEWLAAHIPGAVYLARKGEGHISLFRHVDEIIDRLADAGGL